MIPYLLAAVGGYLIGQSRKDEKFADGGMVDKKIESLESALKNQDLSPKVKRQLKMKLNEMRALKEGKHSESSKYRKYKHGGTINFNGEKYPIKTISGYNFAQSDLYEKLTGSDGEFVNNKAAEIDSSIAMYLDDEEWNMSDEEIFEMWESNS